MLAKYVADTSSWEPWQRDYRCGVILVMPPPHVASTIDALRRALDPKAHAICSAKALRTSSSSSPGSWAMGRRCSRGCRSTST